MYKSVHKRPFAQIPKTKIGFMFIEISGLDGESDVREGVMDKTEKVINTYPLRTLLGQFRSKTLNTVLRRFQKGYNKLLEKKRIKETNNPKITIVTKNVVKVHQIQWLDGCLVTGLTPAIAAIIK